MVEADDLPVRLKACLVDRYDVIREIGRGGWAVVYLATDRRHDRPVAIKVLLPELAAVVGTTRFLREIAVVAHLDHPHIIPLYDSGEVAGLPYYVMRYVEGESLHNRILREKQLSLEETVELTGQVAAALDYAHSRGFIHRDIKPQNILLAEGGPLVADFGLAIALATTGGEKLTGTGLAVGSLQYMSPEQAAGTGRVDHRTDIYSLGCLVYEALVGEPPFSGRTPQAVVARHTLEPVPDLRVVRSTIPPEMEQAVKKALAKIPADRFRSASDFAQALRAGLAHPATAVRRPSRQRSLTRRAAAALSLVGLLAIVALVLGRVDGGRGAPLPPSGSVAVLPFRFSGPVDSTVLTPAETVELLSTRLTGSDVMRPVDPEVVLRDWQSRRRSYESASDQEAIGAAAKLGADLALLGTVQATRSTIVLGGAIYSVAGGEPLYRVDGISGPPDSVVPLLDRFVISLLLQRVGEGWRRLEALTADRLEAVKPYVAGLEQYRRGRYAAAAQAFERAVQVQPDFVLARVRLGQAYMAAGDIESALRVLDEAWEERARLARDDSLYLAALLGRRHPAPTSYAVSLRTWEWVADSLPHYWEGAYELGEMLFQWGPMLGKERSQERARVAFQQALKADSAFAPALEGLIDLAAVTGDTVELERLSQRYFTVDSGADHTDYVRWRLAVALGDSSARREIRGRFATFGRTELEQILGTSQLDGIAMEDAVAAVTELRRRARNEYDLWWTGILTRQLALNRGRPGDAPQERVDVGFSLPLDELYRVVEAIYWSGDRETAARVVASEVGEADRRPPGVPDAGDPRSMRLCAVSLWRLASGEVDLVAATLDRLRAAVRGADAQRATMYLPVCAAIVEARAAALTGKPEADRLRASLDSVLRSGPVTNPYIRLAGWITLAELEEQRGDLHAALTALRQRPYQPSVFGVTGLSELLLREARLAARTGDRAGATRSFDHFLRLRADAEPQFQPENARVRAELERLAR